MRTNHRYRPSRPFFPTRASGFSARTGEDPDHSSVYFYQFQQRECASNPLRVQTSVDNTYHSIICHWLLSQIYPLVHVQLDRGPPPFLTLLTSPSILPDTCASRSVTYPSYLLFATRLTRQSPDPLETPSESGRPDQDMFYLTEQQGLFYHEHFANVESPYSIIQGWPQVSYLSADDPHFSRIFGGMSSFFLTQVFDHGVTPHIR
ncbi:hypothetical protein C8R44DRAFT_874684 [Mycena epipterygia]|nr:hypothetical protein C8R44DRAFT_874684 [Mycena epipterygia]